MKSNRKHVAAAAVTVALAGGLAGAAVAGSNMPGWGNGQHMTGTARGAMMNDTAQRGTAKPNGMQRTWNGDLAAQPKNSVAGERKEIERSVAANFNASFPFGRDHSSQEEWEPQGPIPRE